MCMGGGGGKAVYSPGIKSHCFNEHVPLDCEVYKCFLVFSPQLGWDGWVDLAAIDNTPAG